MMFVRGRGPFAERTVLGEKFWESQITRCWIDLALPSRVCLFSKESLRNVDSSSSAKHAHVYEQRSPCVSPVFGRISSACLLVDVECPNVSHRLFKNILVRGWSLQFGLQILEMCLFNKILSLFPTLQSLLFDSLQHSSSILQDCPVTCSSTEKASKESAHLKNSSLSGGQMSNKMWFIIIWISCDTLFGRSLGSEVQRAEHCSENSSILRISNWDRPPCHSEFMLPHS